MRQLPTNRNVKKQQDDATIFQAGRFTIGSERMFRFELSTWRY
jgi:hypothetical protein